MHSHFDGSVVCPAAARLWPLAEEGVVVPLSATMETFAKIISVAPQLGHVSLDCRDTLQQCVFDAIAAAFKVGCAPVHLFLALRAVGCVS